MNKYDIEFNTSISFDSRDYRLLILNLGKESISIPRKGIVKGFEKVYQIAKIKDGIVENIKESFDFRNS